MPITAMNILTLTGTALPVDGNNLKTVNQVQGTMRGFLARAQGAIWFNVPSLALSAATGVGWQFYKTQNVAVARLTGVTYRPISESGVTLPVGLTTGSLATYSAQFELQALNHVSLLTLSGATYSAVHQSGTQVSVPLAGLSATFYKPKDQVGVTLPLNLASASATTFAATTSLGIKLTSPLWTLTGNALSATAQLGTTVPVRLATGTTKTFAPTYQTGAQITATLLVGSLANYAPSVITATQNVKTLTLTGSVFKVAPGITAPVSEATGSLAIYSATSETGTLVKVNAGTVNLSAYIITNQVKVTQLVDTLTGSFNSFYAAGQLQTVYNAPTALLTGTVGYFNAPALIDGSTLILVARQMDLFVQRADIYRRVIDPASTDVIYYPYIVDVPCFLHTTPNVDRTINKVGLVIKQENVFTVNRLNVPAGCDVRDTDKIFLSIAPYPFGGPTPYDGGTWWSVRGMAKIRMRTASRDTNKSMVYVDPDSQPPIGNYDPVTGQITLQDVSGAYPWAGDLYGTN